MRTLLRTLGVGRFLYNHVLCPAQLIHMLLRDTDEDVRRIQLLHIGKHRGRRLAGTPAAQMHSHLWGTCELIEIARETLPPASPVWDIGAHTGTWSVLARSLLPASPVVCVEPLPEHTAHIRALSERLQPFTLIEAAVGAAPGTHTLHRTNRSDSSSLLPPSDIARRNFQVQETDRLTVPVTTLDAILEQTGRPPGLIKLDVQGYELEALKGGTRTLPHTRFLIAEVSFQELYRGQPLAGEVIAWLHQRQFAPVAFGAEIEGGQRLLQTDILFQNTALA